MRKCQNVTYNNVKSPKKTRASPSLQKIHFGKTEGGGGGRQIDPPPSRLRVKESMYDTLMKNQALGLIVLNC